MTTLADLTKLPNKKNIVVVGGGTAGANICRPLSSSLNLAQYNLILVNPLPFRVWLPSILRHVVSASNKASDVFLPYDKLFVDGRGIFVQAKVTMVEPGNGRKDGEVVLDSGEKIPYHILVFAMGSKWEGPPSVPHTIPEEVQAHVKMQQERFEKANHILIVGGGAIGCEISGEVKDKWPHKQVTIVHASRLLLNPTYSDKFRATAEKGLRQRGVNIVLNDFVDFKESGEVPNITVTTRFKTLVHGVDLIVHARGPKPNTSLVSDSLGPDALNESGHIKIKPTLQLAEYDNIFATGDVIDWQEQKQAIKARNHGKLVAHNIQMLLDGYPMKNYKGSTEMILLTNGRNRGVTFVDVLSGLMMRDWVTKKVKSKDLLASIFKQQQGYA